MKAQTCTTYKHKSHKETHNPSDDEIRKSNPSITKKRRKIVIVGSGIAALSAATTLRSLDQTCHIDIYSEESTLPYMRMHLSKSLHRHNPSTFLIHEQAWYDKHQIQLHLNEKIVSLCDKAKTIQTKDGKQIPYDELILAMGTHAYIPPIPGHTMSHVYTLHTLQDATTIADTIKRSRRCVVVGGGILGIEMACALSDAHVDVTLIEALPTLMAKHLDPLGSHLLMNHLKKQKIHVLLHTKITAFHGISRMESVELEHGKCINADFVLCATGTQANLELVKSTGIDYEQFIHVDPQMRTNLPHIYACGDIASVNGHHDGLWSTAQKQGEIVAKTICGQTAHVSSLHQPLYFHHDQFSCFLLGDIHQMDQYIECFDEVNNSYEKYGFQDGLCCGALLINRAQRINDATNAFLHKQPYPLQALNTHNFAS